MSILRAMKKYNLTFFEFIQQNLNADPQSLRLSLKKENFDFDIEDAVNQIEYRKKNATKLKRFIDSPIFLFPDMISGEQSSHQAVAVYHSSIVEKTDSILDMTAGLGIDAMTFALKGSKVTAIEMDSKKADTLKKNISSLGLMDFVVINADSINFLKSHDNYFEVIYIDPARRDSSLKRVYNLRDCSPDVIENQDLLVSKADRILIKASPLLDITQTIKDFNNLISIRAIGVKGECKELLIEISSKKENQELKIGAINLDNDGNFINQFWEAYNPYSEEKQNKQISFAGMEEILPGNFLLEPSSMIMKISPWSTICEKYTAKKLGKSSNLFVSSSFPKNFPGRITKIEKIIKKQDRKSFAGFPASVVSRNYPLSSEEIRKSFKLKEGDDKFIYASRLGEKPIMILTEKI